MLARVFQPYLFENCAVSNKHWTDPFVFHYLVSVTPVITDISDAIVTAGSQATFTCTATAPNEYNIAYQWAPPSGSVSNDNPYTIDSVSVSQAGTYTCTATVSHSNEYVLIQNPAATDTATLTVTSKQTMTTFHLRERESGGRGRERGRKSMCKYYYIEMTVLVLLIHSTYSISHG